MDLGIDIPKKEKKNSTRDKIIHDQKILEVQINILE